jgi:tRNA(Ile)-lysidine synthase
VPAAERRAAPVSDSELDRLFSFFEPCRRVILAVSGGPDSVALMFLAARWLTKHARAPELVAATVDHRLRRESRAEARAVAGLAAELRLRHHTLVWSGPKPRSGLQEAARAARYRMLMRLARKIGADAIATAHTQDDQAETLLMRMARGSGVTGLGGMRRVSARDGIALFRPLLGLPKARLVATLRKAGIPFAEDPTNLDPRYARARLRKLLPLLAAEGLDAARLARVAGRIARADAALDATAEAAEAQALLSRNADKQLIELNAAALFTFPAEISLRLLRRAIDAVGDEGPVELGKLESLFAALVAAYAADRRLKRTLAGAAVTLDRARLALARAPRRRRRT